MAGNGVVSAGFPPNGRWADRIPQSQAVIVAANIRFLRKRRGWNQAKVGELMGWHISTVCAAEGHRSGWRRGFTTADVERLALIFGVSPSELITGCPDCAEHPPPEFACPACGARGACGACGARGARAGGPVAPPADADRDLRVLTLLAAIDQQLQEARRLLTRVS
jgi:hypothetical protein